MKSLHFPRGFVLLLAGVFLLLASGMRHSTLIHQREEENLQMVPPQDTTPLVTLTTVAFGGFRGLVADALWVRANNMQESGQFFEMVQLAKWITQLEPRVPEVWAFQAWNLAYNISVLFPEPEDRWRWVSHGINLLKEEGLLHNPTSPGLHWEIGWMYQHKIGMQFDLAHLTYKNQLAEHMETALPDGTLPDESLSPEQRKILTAEFSMDPNRMRSLDKAFGPLDWRIPETHSLYWSSKGLTYRANEFRTRSLRRMKMQSLSWLMRSGLLLKDQETGASILLPRLDLIPTVQSHYEELLEGQPINRYLMNGYKNFLLDSAVMYAEYGRLSESLDMYSQLASIDESIPGGRENFQSFIQSYLIRDPATLDRRQAMFRVVALLQNSQNPEISTVRSQGFVSMASQVHRIYQESRTSEDHRKRTGLPPFDVIRRMLGAS